MTVSDELPGPNNFNVGKLVNSLVLPGRIVAYGGTFYSSRASAQWLHFYDANAVPANGSTPLFAWNLSANSGVGFGWQPNGRQWQTGLVVVNSSTETTTTIGSADCFLDVQFDVYDEQNAPGTGA